MSTKHLVAWAATFVVLLVIDMIWLGVVAYPIGLLLFAIVPGVEAQSVLRAAVLGALFGMFCYGTYDLTNLAVIRNWPLALSFIDIVWGALVSGVAAAAGAVAWRWMAAH